MKRVWINIVVFKENVNEIEPIKSLIKTCEKLLEHFYSNTFYYQIYVKWYKLVGVEIVMKVLLLEH